jgi:hypothetical protein
MMVATLAMMTGCVPALIVTGMVQHGKTKKTQQEFTSQFNANNTDRESKKLPPLEWCEEVKKFNMGWYRQQKQCPQTVFKKRM